jgi:hypothetical protein
MGDQINDDYEGFFPTDPFLVMLDLPAVGTLDCAEAPDAPFTFI